MARWLLPDGISDVLPAEARQLENLRRDLLDLYRSYGYELVIPPLLEYLDSLLTGTGRDLDLRTFKLVDQLSGRQLGLRADITPQTARIDAHIMNRPGIVRLCYAGSVLHARPAHPLATREPLQVGAELYGHSGLAADGEMLVLAAESLRRADLGEMRFDFGHTGVVRALLTADPAAMASADDILAALSAKDMAALRQVSAVLAPATEKALLQLAELFGESDVLDRARLLLPPLPGLLRALDELRWLVERAPEKVGVDLSDLHGYRYYTGVNFAVYAEGAPAALLRGGRYDDIGRAFGRARPATGFSIDLRELSALKGRRNGLAAARAILAPAAPAAAGDDAELSALIAKLRSDGEIVVQLLEPGDVVEGFELDREIQRDSSKSTSGAGGASGRWQVKPRKRG